MSINDAKKNPQTRKKVTSQANGTANGESTTQRNGANTNGDREHHVLETLIDVSRSSTDGDDNAIAVPPAKSDQDSGEHLQYVVDTRPVCQGMPFVLTDQAHPRHVVKHGSHFLVLDQSGTIPSCNTLGYGYYRYDTRHLSQWELFLHDVPLSLLSADFTRGYEAELLYTNVHSELIDQQKLTIQRKIVLTDVLWESIVLENFDSKPVDIDLKFLFQSDFADMFEVRGLNRPNRGQRMMPVSGTNGSIFLAYKGLDGMLLETCIEFKSGAPTQVDEGIANFHFTLPVRQPQALELCITTRWNRVSPKTMASGVNFKQAEELADESYDRWRKSMSTIVTDHDVFNVAIEHSFRDLYILRQPTPKGIGIAAGVPWYSTLFGRDSAITALQMVPFAPELTRNCIDVLAAYQGQKTDIFRAERAGKILHEIRLGELARLHEIPHTPYYGTVDATQLWLILLGEYIDWTGDLEYARQMWDAAKLALKFLDNASKTGYISYIRESPIGLENQGWKDSGDSVMHRNGRLAEPPIAICEAQAYLHLAWRKMSRLAKLLGYNAMAKSLTQKADELKKRFRRDFWMEQEQFVALALDKHGEQVKVATSNPGHCLWSEILDDDIAHIVADKLMSAELFSGWGIRTLSSNTCAYNPISYHNGSVWPHDNGIILEGFRKIGRVADAQKVFAAMFDTMQHQVDFRLPELFCGFQRTESQHPIDYPVSCRPQAWACGVIFQMLRACVNIVPEAPEGRVRIVEPVLPTWLEYLELNRLRVGNSEIDLALRTDGTTTYCQILKKQGSVRVLIET